MTDAQRSLTRRLLRAWLIAVALMAIGFLVDRKGEHQHLGFSAPELSSASAEVAFFTSVKFSLLELAVLLAILRPWSFTARTRYRAAIGLLLFAPYAVLILLLGPGGMLSSTVHGCWVFSIVIRLIFAMLTPIQAIVPLGQERPSLSP